MLLEQWQTDLSEGKDFSDDDFVETPLVMHFYRQRIPGQVTDRLIGKKFVHGVLGRFYGQRDWDRRLFECGIAHRAGDAVDNEHEVAGSEGLSEKHSVADVCQEREGGEVALAINGTWQQWHMTWRAMILLLMVDMVLDRRRRLNGSRVKALQEHRLLRELGIIWNNVITSSKCHIGFCKS